MRRYRLVRGVRFQTGIPREWIEAFLGEEEMPEKFHYSANDDLCYLEHRSVGGSAPSSLRPLTPYSILAGNRTADELAGSGRNRQGTMWGRYVFDPASDYEEILDGEDGGNIRLRIPKSVRQAFFEAILSFPPVIISPKYPTFICVFDKPAFDPKTSRIILPNLLEVNHTKLARKFAATIRMKEILLNEYEMKRVVVDRKGWRVDMI